VAFAHQLGVLFPLAVAASITIVYGSLRALTQDDLKRRLAFSTVSQVSYIALGVSMIGATATTGGLVHLVHQGVMKITLFFCAGIFAETLHIKTVSGMKGIGRRLPLSMAAFTIGAFGMIGVPPMAGFVSKWYLALGALDARAYWVLGVLAASSALNAAYFLPIVYRIWFCKSDGVPDRQKPAAWLEARQALLWPPVVTVLLALASGLFAASRVSPLAWAQLITVREFAP
jgi:multicomponent Na+:H+ antiporter subunit D